MNHPNAQMRAELLDSNFTAFDAKLIAREVEMVRSLKPKLGRYVYHTTLNFSNEDFLNSEQMLAIAKEYLAESGYGNNQYLIFRHYDAEHPHIHLLVNRITFDGEVVSDSNNYKKSEAIVRKLEAKYGLVTVAPSKEASQRAVTKAEIEMMERTGKPSDKLLLQELMNQLLHNKGMDIEELIRKGEQAGIHFLFNQASTGRVSGITYFYGGLKIRGQALGNRYKWAELIKTITYEQGKHGQGISQANDRTKAKYGELSEQDGIGKTGRTGLPGAGTGVIASDLGAVAVERHSEREVLAGISRDLPISRSADRSVGADRETATITAEQASETILFDDRDYSSTDLEIYRLADIEIADDIDDEAIHGRNRHRKKQARTNRR